MIALLRHLYPLAWVNGLRPLLAALDLIVAQALTEALRHYDALRGVPDEIANFAERQAG